MKKIISYSLWGNIDIYCIGAVKNAILAKKYFPGWKCRFYYDNTVPKKIIDYLNNLDNTEMFFIEKPSGGKKFKDNGQFGMFWRFYPFNDDNVEIWLARDTDSRLSKYEYYEIEKFINSDNVLHSFRNENEKPCRGCGTSFKNFNKKTDTRIINGEKLDLFNLISNINRDHCPFYTDENFLNNILFPLYKEKYLWVPRKFNIEHELKQLTYVGQMVTENDQWLKGHPEKTRYLNNSKNNYNFSEIDNFYNYFVS